MFEEMKGGSDLRVKSLRKIVFVTKKVESRVKGISHLFPLEEASTMPLAD